MVLNKIFSTSKETHEYQNCYSFRQLNNRLSMFVILLLFFISGDNRHLEVSPDIVQRVMHLIEETEEFTILVAVKQRSLNVGTIFSIASKNYR